MYIKNLCWILKDPKGHGDCSPLDLQILQTSRTISSIVLAECLSVVSVNEEGSLRLWSYSSTGIVEGCLWSKIDVCRTYEKLLLPVSFSLLNSDKWRVRIVYNGLFWLSLLSSYLKSSRFRWDRMKLHR